MKSTVHSSHHKDRHPDVDTSTGFTVPHENVAYLIKALSSPALPQFRAQLLGRVCQTLLMISILSTIANVYLGHWDEMMLMSMTSILLLIGFDRWIKFAPHKTDLILMILLVMGGVFVAIGWFQFGGVLGSGPALIYPLASLCFIFSTQRSQLIALMSLVGFITLLMVIHAYVPQSVDPYYATTQDQVMDVAFSHLIGVGVCALLFMRLASHHRRGWAELTQQQNTHLNLLHTHMKRDHQELQERIALTERISDGVAHDVNNVLTVILASAELLESTDDLEIRDDIIESTQTATRLLRRFRQHNTSEVDRVNVVSMLLLIERSINRLAPNVATSIHCSDPNLIAIVVREQLEQVILNLCLNAVQAMKSHGDLQINVGTPTSDLITIQVKDSGVGITVENQKKIFDPFFTTRADQGGTGVGLANVSQIVREWGGVISVESVLGEGTCFTLSIPTPLPESY